MYGYGVELRLYVWLWGGAEAICMVVCARAGGQAGVPGEVPLLGEQSLVHLVDRGREAPGLADPQPLPRDQPVSSYR